MYWVSWTKVVASKKVDGLGVGSIKAQNLALLTKWQWRLKENFVGLCKECINSIHNLTRKPATVIAKSYICGVWSNVSNAINSIP